MSRAEDLQAKAARLKDRQAAPSSTSGSTSVPTEILNPAGRAVRVRPVRLTVDVAPADHAALGRWCLDAAAELGLARVHGQELVRALIRRALHDPDLRAIVTADAGTTRAST